MMPILIAKLTEKMKSSITKHTLEFKKVPVLPEKQSEIYPSVRGKNASHKKWKRRVCQWVAIFVSDEQVTFTKKQQSNEPFCLEKWLATP